MDRLLNDISIDRSGPVARAIKDANISGINTAGEIQEDAPHWAIETFVPVQVGPLVEFLLERDELSQRNRERFRQFCDKVHSIQHDQSDSYLRRFAAAYANIDPDNDCRDPFETPPSEEDPPPEPAKLDRDAADKVTVMCDEILTRAGYTKLGREDIEACAETVSQFGVPLHVDFALFDKLEVYARGDIVGTRVQRRLMNFYRRELVTIPIYQRMVVIFELADDDQSDEELTSSTLHLRMFKNIPKLDIDMLLPGSRVRIGRFDSAKFLLPSLGGFLMSIRRVAQYTVLFTAFTAIALSKSIILVVLIVAFLIKSVFSSVFGYFRTKKHYQLNLTRNLYFQKLDCNAGVFYRIIQQSERQGTVEILFAYYGILIGDEPISERKLRRRCERLVREAVDVEVDFQVERAIERLANAKLIEETDEAWQVVSADYS
jgi:hypothetical protein